MKSADKCENVLPSLITGRCHYTSGRMRSGNFFLSEGVIAKLNVVGRVWRQHIAAHSSKEGISNLVSHLEAHNSFRYKVKRELTLQ